MKYLNVLVAIATLISVGCSSIGPKQTGSKEKVTQAPVEVYMPAGLSAEQEKAWHQCIADVNKSPEKYGYKSSYPKIVSVKSLNFGKMFTPSSSQMSTGMKQTGRHVGTAALVTFLPPVGLAAMYFDYKKTKAENAAMAKSNAESGNVTVTAANVVVKCVSARTTPQTNFRQ